ncbi:hypothetical protein PGT21_002138 [Puccinia graminis f. sp. tritici]|uniref:Uncharacterized protein n=1 Tax=Puccinia graminis f. sp. tritici TaxID=56615 RepID=A0A5B0NWG3_PUCGR|nr:hypothetical protein PGT21_002138 [Puccinia graminis f. sp. tritici]KAA1105112.1 hypothetical protein PGTUg99_012516 [Puccinia graminis f. sp. tritici]
MAFFAILAGFCQAQGLRAPHEKEPESLRLRCPSWCTCDAERSVAAAGDNAKLDDATLAGS